MRLKTIFTTFKHTLFLAAIFVSASCSTQRITQNNKQVAKQVHKNTPNTQAYSTLSYIDAFKKVAIEEMNKSGIPASITLAQGILESGSGNSELAKNANNHFGIKRTSDWNGQSYYKDDDQKNEAFRVYKDARESYKDHSEFLKRKRYAALFDLDKNDYKGWAYGLKNAGYATNPKYPDLLINTIEKYNLQQYDQPETEAQKTVRENKVLAQIEANTSAEKNNDVAVYPAPKYPVRKQKDTIQSSTEINTPNYYVVKQGDTLYSLSKAFNLTVDELKELNNLSDNSIKIGQKLLVVK